MRVAPELDRLMWAVAEEADDRAVAEFLARYPELRAELTKRLNLVSGLRGARAAVPAAREVPRFAPPAQSNKPMWRRQTAVAACLGLLVLASASFFTTRTLVARDEPLASPPPVLQQSHQGVVTNESPQVQRVEVAPVQQTPVVPPPDSEGALPHLKRYSLRLEGAPLLVALRAIAEECRIQLEIAPGMDNPLVNMSYTERTGMHMLQDLGARYGFTPFDQGDGLILIIPVVDQSAPTASGNDVYGDVAPRG